MYQMYRKTTVLKKTAATFLSGLHICTVCLMLEGNGKNTNETDVSGLISQYNLSDSGLCPFMSLSIFLFPAFGSTPSCPVLYLPCPCSNREIHTWRTLSVGYCMFISRHQHIHYVAYCDSHLTILASSGFPNASFGWGYSHKMVVLYPILPWLRS